MSTTFERRVEPSSPLNQALFAEETGGADVRRWLREARFGVLSTLSTRGGLEGFPVGTVAPFAVGPDGEIVLYLAEIAAHTRDVLADGRVSFSVSDPACGEDPQRSWRLSILGRLERLLPESRADALATLGGDVAVVSDEDYAEIVARHQERAARVGAREPSPAFFFWRMSPVEELRAAVGPGRIGWLKGEALRPPTPAPGLRRALEAGMERMNAEHPETMAEIARGIHGVNAEAVSMVGIDPHGFTLLADGRRLRCSFPAEVEEGGVRAAIAAVLKRALGARA